jgi:glycine oxidase
MINVDAIIVGQGIAGSTAAWTLHRHGYSVCIVDQRPTITASSIAAGLITPITGKRYVKSSDFEPHWSVAQEFYRDVQSLTGTSFFQRQTILRLFKDAADQEFFQSRRLEKYQQEIALQTSSNGQVTGFEMEGGRLRCSEYLEATRAFFQSQDSILDRLVEGPHEIEHSESRVTLPAADVAAHVMIWCIGDWQRKQPPFPEIPDSPCRGDILRLKIPEYEEQRVVSSGVWLAPEPDGTFVAGSTYDWEHLSNEPRESGRRKILGQLRAIVNQPVEVLQHEAAVRPAMKTARPVWQTHPQQPRIAALNGLGARGALWAPLQAAELLQHLIDRKWLPERAANAQ